MTLERSTEYERLKQAASSVWSAGNMYIGPSMTQLMQFLVEYKRLSPEYEQPATAPAGYKIVPVEPTPEMQKAGAEVPLNKAARHNVVFRRMLEAAPQPPALTDERIFKLFLEKAVDKGTAGIYDFARAIEREILG